LSGEGSRTPSHFQPPSRFRPRGDGHNQEWIQEIMVEAMVYVVEMGVQGISGDIIVEEVCIG
jgi:hypothetical protein